MRKQLLSTILAICIVLTMATAAFASTDSLVDPALETPDSNDIAGSTEDNPILVPESGLVIESGTLYGIDKTWFAENNPSKGTLYLSVILPNTVTSIAMDGLKDSYTTEKKKYGAVTYVDKLGSFSLSALDCSLATNLTTIGNQAFQNAKLTGVLDLSPTQVTAIGKSAFSGCSSLTGVVLPDTLEALGEKSQGTGSVFNGCSSLEYIRLGDSSEDTIFELPDTLTYIGKQTFKDCFADGINAQVVIPATVEVIGSEAFYSKRISQMIVSRQGDGWDPQLTNYDTAAFKTGNADLLVVFKDQTSYVDYTAGRSFTSAVKNALAYPLTITFYDTSEGTITQNKLNYQSLRYILNERSGFWEIDENYTLPQPSETSQDKPGYTAHWTISGQKLTEDTKLNTNLTAPKVKVDYVIQNPTIQHVVDGVVQEGFSTLTVTLDGTPGHTVGVQVQHPLLLGENGTESAYVYFQYCWWDEVHGNSVNGPRSELEPELFSNSPGNGVLNRVKTDYAVIPIDSVEHMRTSPDQYMVEIYGYLVEEGKEPQLFYKSHHNFIDFIQDTDREATVDTCYTLQVNVVEDLPISHEVTFLPGEHGTLQGDTSFAVPDGTTMQDNGFVLPSVAAKANYRFTGWQGKDQAIYNNEQVLALTMTEGMEFTAQYKRKSSGGGIPYYTLHYESNGGTEYGDEQYQRNTIVDLDKVPTREDYIFTGWYDSKELVKKIDEIEMTSDKIVYAGWEASNIPDWLNGQEHTAYIIGYADGTVRPEKNMSRAEVAAIIFRLLKEDIREQNLMTSSPFTDIEEDMWYHTAVSTLAKLAIVQGRSAEIFDADAFITRAEFAAICARFDDSNVSGYSNFTDISGHWAEDEIMRAAALGWVRGYHDNTFRPNDLITRAEVMTMSNRVLNRLPEDESSLLDNMNRWSDNPPGTWYYLAVQEATNSHTFAYQEETGEYWTKIVDTPDWTQYQ